MNKDNLALLADLASGQRQRTIEAAGALARAKVTVAAPQLLDVLRTTSDPTVRNAVALALGELKAPAAFDAIVELLRSERTRRHRGTLLHALHGYDCASIMPLLVDFTIDGGFEVMNEAAQLLAKIDSVEDAVREACTQRLRTALPAVPPADEARRQLLGEILAMFE